MKKLYNANSSFEAVNLSNMLTSAGIENRIDDYHVSRGASLSMETSIKGVNIYVKEEDENAAKEVLNEYLLQSQEESLLDQDKVPWYNSRKKQAIIVRVFIIVFVLGIICLRFFK